jgi:tRNA (uracil-5-)-methyltransferase TRM9
MIGHGVLDETIQTLLEINRRFYGRNAASFARSRDRPWPGWDRAVDRWQCHRADRAEPLRVLDLGCGNGRFWPYLTTRIAGPAWILGVDRQLALLGWAGHQAISVQTAAPRVCADLSAADELPIVNGRFHLVTAFGLLHHLPSEAMRLELLAAAGGQLCAGGVLVVTFWRRSVLARKRVVHWETYGRQTGVEVDVSDLDAGDVLLGWGDPDDEIRQARVRYCHLFADEEVARLVTQLAAVDVVDTYLADGPSGQDNRYLVLKRSARGGSRDAG